MMIGTGVDSRRKAIINGRFGDEALFKHLYNEFKRRYAETADGFQANMLEQAKAHLDAIRDDMDLLRDENVALESERDPEFRELLGYEVENAKTTLRDIRGRLTEQQ